MNKLTHIDSKGQTRMVDVSDKDKTNRIAIAQSFISMNDEVLDLIESGGHKKGDVLATARIAGIMAAKQTSVLIPMCHTLLLNSIKIDLDINKKENHIKIVATCKLNGQTGVEMEALTAVSIAALTLYDMCKAIDKAMVIGNTQLVHKSGGASGNWDLGI